MWTAVRGMLWLIAAVLLNAQTQQHSRSVTVQRGQVLEFETVQPLDSRTAMVSDDVPLRLKRDFVVEGVKLLSAGATAHGRVVRVKRAGPKCAFGKIRWTVDSVSFQDSTRASTEIMLEVPRSDIEVPERYPSKAIQRGRHDPVRLVALSPVLIPLTVLGLPGLVAMASSDSNGAPPCTEVGSEYVLPPKSTIAVAIVTKHRVRC